MDGANPIWEGVPGVIIPLSGQTITTRCIRISPVKSVFVKAVTNGKDLGLRLDWSDQTKNDTAIGPQDFRDQVAIMFPVNTAGAPPFQCMGQSGGTVNIWRWNAEWQKDLGGIAPESGTSMTSILEFSGTTISKSRRVESPIRIVSAGALAHSTPVFGPATSCLTRPARQLRRGSECQRVQHVDHAVPSGCDRQWRVGAVRFPQGGGYTGPTWRVVVKRSLETSDANDTQFKAGASVPIAFAVWDGSNIERNGMKSLSTWFTLKLP